MFAIGNDELKEKEDLGDYVLCDKCGEKHKIEFGKEKMDDGTLQETKLLAFYKCGDAIYLAGIKGKRV